MLYVRRHGASAPLPVLEVPPTRISPNAVTRVARETLAYSRGGRGA